jgi:hypothetical protein
MMDQSLSAQMQPYTPWLLIAGVFVLFMLLRVTRKGVRSRVDEIGYRYWREKGLLIWFWLNAPGVILHELSHALVVLLFSPFGFRITNIALFRIKPVVQRGPNGRIVKNSGKQSLQLGEVQYVRPAGHIMSFIGDGLSAIAPLFGGFAMLALLYWAATGYNLWDIHLRLLRPGWPWWTLTFAPYLILTVTSELWPSRQDWRGARRLVIGLLIASALFLALLWLAHFLVFNNATLQITSSIAAHIDFALLVLLALDIVFFLIAEFIARLSRR